MSHTESPPGRPSPVTATLTADRLGVPAVISFVQSAATPLTIVAGVVTTAYIVTGRTGFPLAFLLIGGLFAVFSVGYVEMARRLGIAGGLYAFVACGLGRPAGVGAAWVALLAYNALQVGLYGIIGAAAAPLLETGFGLHLPWWVIAATAWLLTAVLGLLRVEINGTVLAVLILAEVGVMLVYSVAALFHPAEGGVTFAAFSPGRLFGDGAGAMFALGVLAFIGLESAVLLSRWSKDPQRTVRSATYLSIGGITVLYAFSSWATTVAVGPDRIVEASRADGIELIFNLAAVHLGQTAANIGHVFFVTSCLAATISFHNIVAQYMFSLGREHVLPAALGRTSRRTGSPRNASLLQSGLGLTVIAVFAVNGWDPIVHMFYLLGTSGGLGVLLLLAATAVAVLAYFTLNRAANMWREVIAPTLAVAGLHTVAVLALSNLPTLLGVPPDHPFTWLVPTAFALAAVLGIGWGLLLKQVRPQVYRLVGLGADSATARHAPTVPHPRTPAHQAGIAGREARR